MSSIKIVRNSKFRHVFGQAVKRQDCYDNIRITKSSWDSTYCCINPKYIAIITEAAGGGAFLVNPIEKTGRVDRDTPLVVGHKAMVLDIAWCPHNDNLIASSSEDGTIKVWEIPDGGLTRNLSEPVADLCAHQRRVGVINWHPSAYLVLLSAGSDNKLFVWNVATAEILTEISFHTDTIYSAVWNYNGSQILTTCKDKMIRVFNPRTGALVKEGKGHQATKPMRALFMRDGRIFTTGFSRTGERQYALWDPEKMENIVMEDVDNSNGLLFPFYDEDTNIIYLCGKGDSNIRFYEYTPSEQPFIHQLSLYGSSEPQRGIGYMPKRGCNVSNCEIAKFYKLHNSGLCEVITMTVPRKSELFQEDLYPDTAAQQPAILDAEEWYRGRDADPVLMSLRDVFNAYQMKNGGANVLRQASRRIPGALDQKSQRDSTISIGANGASEAAQNAASASMSRLSVNMMKPPASNNNHEPSPQPPSNGTSNAPPATFSHKEPSAEHLPSVAATVAAMSSPVHETTKPFQHTELAKSSSQTNANSNSLTLSSLKAELDELRQTVSSQEKKIEELERKLSKLDDEPKKNQITY